MAISSWLESSTPTFTKEAKTQNVHLRPYHDPTKLKSREDVEMRILYKGVGWECRPGLIEKKGFKAP